MAAEVVGSALVRIRAITTGLARDIEKGTKQGIKDAHFDKHGETAGGDFAGGFDKQFTNDLKKVFGRHDLIDKKDGERGGEDFGGSVIKGFDKAIGKGDFKKVSKLLSKQISDDFSASFHTDFNKAIGDGNFEAAQKLLRKRSDLLGEDTGHGFLAGLRRVFKRDGGGAGTDAGGIFSGGFLKGGLLKIGLIASPAILGAVSALLQYVVSLVGQIGFLATAIGGLGAAGGAAFAAVGLSAIPLLLAFKANTPALENFKKVLEGVGKQWQEVGAATQKTLFGPLTQALKLTTKLIPVFRAFGKGVGDVTGNFALWNAQFFTRNLELVRDILQQSVPVFKDVVSSVFHLTAGFTLLLHSALPVAKLFSDDLAKITSRFREILQLSDANGTLTATLKIWYDRARLVVGALSDIVIAIGHVLGIGANSAGSFFDTFDRFAARFRAFTESEAGKSKLAAIFEQANAVAHEFNGLVGDIVKAIGGAVFDAGGADGIIGFIHVLRTDFVPVLDNLAKHISSSYGPALLDLFKTFGKLLKTLDESDTILITLKTLNVTLEILDRVLRSLMSIPGFDTFVTKILGLYGALALLSKIPGLGLLFGALKQLVDKALISGLTALAGALSGAAAAIGGLFGLTGAAAIAAGAAVIIAAIALIAGGAYLIIRNWSTIKEFFTGIFGFLRRNFKTIGAVIGAALLGPLGIGALIIIKNWDTIREFFAALPGRIGGFLAEIGGLFEGLLGVVGRALARFGPMIFQAIAGAIVAVTKALPGLFVEFITWWFTLPFQIIGAFAQLGALIIAAFVNAVALLIAALPGIWNAVFDFFTKLPGRIISFLDPIGEQIAQIFTDVKDRVFSAINTGWDAVFEFFRGLPGKVINFIAGLPEQVRAIWDDLFEKTRTTVSTGIEDVVGFFTGLPGRIRGLIEDVKKAAAGVGKGIIDGIGDGLSKVGGFLGDLKNAVGKAMLSVVNTFIDKLNGAIPNSLGFGIAKINIPNNPIDHVKLAAGGLVQARPGGILANIGEGRHDEAVLPLPPGVLEGLQALAAMWRDGHTGAGGDTTVNVYEVANDPQATAFRVATVLGEMASR